MKKRIATPMSRGREHAIDSLYDPPHYSSGLYQSQPAADKGYPSYGVLSPPLDYSPRTMDYLKANTDLSPQYPRIDSGLASSSSHRSVECQDPPPDGSRYLSENAAIMLELNRSRSTESSRFNGSVMSGHYDANRVANRSADTSNIDLNKSNLSYRERWDRSRRTAPQRSNIAPSSPIAAPTSYQPHPTYAPNVSTEKLPHKNVASHGKDTSPNRNTSTQWDTAPDSARILIDPSQRSDANRSAVSSGIRDGDQSIVAGSRDIMMHDPSYRVVPLQNGSARPVRDGGNQSLRDASHVTVSEQKETLWTDAPENGTAIRTRLASLAIFSILSLVLALLAMQLIFSLIHQTGSMPSNTFLTNSSYDITHEVAVAMACVVVMLDLCCVLVCAMQGMYAATLCACHHGNLG